MEEQEGQQGAQERRFNPEAPPFEPQQGPVRYGDLRVVSDRRKGACCLFWVVPDVAPGFNTPAFYEDFIEERREHVAQQLATRAEKARREQPPPPPPEIK